jgi:hypothetical protein
MVDYIGDPTQYCQEHDQWFYAHCPMCFNPRYNEPVSLRVAPPRTAPEQAGEDPSPQQPGRQRRRRRKQ